MQKLCRQRPRQRLDRALLRRRQRPQLACRPRQLALPQSLGLLLQRQDRRHRVERLEPLLIARHLRQHNLLRRFGFPRALRPVALRHLLQIVNVVDEAAIHLVHARVHIARHRDIDEKHGPPTPPLNEVRSMRAPKQLLRRARRGNHNVRPLRLRIQRVERNHLHRQLRPAKLRRHLLRARLCPVGDQQMRRAMLDEVPHRQLRHLARTHQQNLLIRQRAKDLSRQIDRDRRNRDRRRPNLRLAPHPLRRRKRALQQPVERRRHRSHLARHRIRLLHLPQNLRLPHHHRVQRRRHPKQMPHRLALPILIHMRTNRRRRHGKVSLKKLQQIGPARIPCSRRGSILQRQQLDPVARRKNQPLLHSRSTHERAGRLRQLPGRNRQTLSNINRRGLVVDPH